MRDQFNGIYRGKRVLVTGHTGFKGSWLSIWLNELGADVAGYALDPYTDKDNFVVTGLKEKLHDIRADVRNYERLSSVFQEYQPEIVFHLAAQPLVRLSYEEPRETYDTNVMGTVNVLECVRETDSVKAAVVITSDKCYENIEKDYAYKETDPVGGYDPYSSSKGCAELVVSAYLRSYFNPDEGSKTGLASARAGNVIGGGDWAKDRIMTDCVLALKSGKTITVRNPDAVRPWQHVLEPLSGYLLLASKLYSEPHVFAGAWNFGPDNSSVITVKALVENLIRIWGSGKWEDVSGEGDPHEANLLMLDIVKAKEILGWTPKLNINGMLNFTADWYKEDSVDYAFGVKQLKDYIEI